MDFETYLHSKKIDSAAFRKAEPLLWENLRVEFEGVSPVSFTAHKLYLINPIRRKYKLAPSAGPTPQEAGTPPPDVVPAADPTAPAPVKNPGAARPVMKPKPKIQ